MIFIIFLFLFTAILSGFLTWLVREFATRLGVVDMPGERKVHHKPIPRMGGLAIFLAFSAVLLLLTVPLPGIQVPLLSSARVFALLVPVTVMTFVGMLDDVFNLKPVQKLVGQIIAAGLAVYMGAGLTTFSFLPGVTLPEWLSAVFTIGWLVFVANAVNLMDGLDGLAGGISLITLCTLLIAATVLGKTELVIPAGLFGAAVIGFLFFNLYPATIFLGDTGSLLLGFTIALLALDHSFVGAASFSVFAPFLMLGLPISETVLTIIRRLESGQIPNVSSRRLGNRLKSKLQKLMQADKLHMHHRFISLGLSHTGTVLSMYSIALIFCFLGLVSILLSNRTVFFILGANMIALLIGFARLGYVTSSFTGNSHFTRRFYAHTVAPHSFFQGIIDLLLVVVAFSLAFMLRYDYYRPPFSHEVFTQLLGRVMIIKMAFFFLTRLYGYRWRIVRSEDIFRVIRSNAFASLAVYVLISSGYLRNDLALSVLLFDFFICVFLMTGTRIAYYVFDERFGSGRNRLRNALLYGVNATNAATYFSKELLRAHGLHPVGLIAGEGAEPEQPEGKKFYGLPIFRGDIDISEAIEKFHIDVLLVDDHLCKQTPGLLSRLQKKFATLEIKLFGIRFSSPELQSPQEERVEIYPA